MACRTSSSTSGPEPARAKHSVVHEAASINLRRPWASRPPGGKPRSSTMPPGASRNASLAAWARGKSTVMAASKASSAIEPELAASKAFSAIEPEQVRPFTRSEYAQMIELGLFQDERLELIRGVLVKMSPQAAP